MSYQKNEIEVRLNNKSEVIKKSETTTINCSNPSCKKPLLIVYLKPDEKNRIDYNLRVQCPFCSRRSYDLHVKGDFKYVTIDGVTLTGIEEDNQTNTVTIKTQKV